MVRVKTEEEQKAEADFSKRRDDILSAIPVEFHPFVRTYAWEQGHASGYDEVLNITEDLVWHLTRAVKSYKINLVESNLR
jgi:hypothetical protein